MQRKREAPFTAVGLAGLVAVMVTLLAACAPLPRRTTLDSRWEPSPNFGERVPGFIVIHYTSNDTAAPALRTLTSRQAQVSAHYLIVRDGSLIQLVDERARAWHAGDSRWGATADLNSVSIGIELDNNGHEPYPPAQIDALLRLLADLRQRYPIPAANVLGHSDVAPTRKSDPGPLFPWRTLAAAGFGLWCEPPYTPAPAGFDALLGLRVIGYDLRHPDAAVRAFRLHFAPEEGDGEAIERDADLIHCLGEAALGR